MSKKRQTKKQKIQASTRHTNPNVITFGDQQITLATTPSAVNKPTTQVTFMAHDYSYVSKDVRKTLFITAFLLGLNIVIFFLLKLAIITIPGIVF